LEQLQSQEARTPPFSVMDCYTLTCASVIARGEVCPACTET